MNELQFSCTNVAGIIGAIMFALLLAKSWVRLKMHPPEEPSAWDETGREWQE